MKEDIDGTYLEMENKWIARDTSSSAARKNICSEKTTQSSGAQPKTFDNSPETQFTYIIRSFVGWKTRN